MSAAARVLDLTPAHEGLRLDAVVADLAGCSRARARELLARGAVTVDGVVQSDRDKGRKLVAGGRLELSEGAEILDRLVPLAAAPLEILAEGEGWIAVAKPAGLPVHPLRADESDSLLQRLVARRPQIEGVGEGGLRSGVVHRLDVDTSGVQVFALDDARHARLRAAFAAHRVDKVYRAVVAGRPDEHGAVELDLVVARHRPAKVRAFQSGHGPDGARTCATRWRCVERLADASLVEARPRSGHLHQIRVTFAHLGHPILGDRLYAPEDVASRAPRQMLHASALRFDDVDAACPDPPDLAHLLDTLRAAG